MSNAMTPDTEAKLFKAVELLDSIENDLALNSPAAVLIREAIRAAVDARSAETRA